MLIAMGYISREEIFENMLRMQGRMQDFSRGGGPTLKFLGF